MPSRAFLLDFLEKKGQEQEGQGRRGREGRQYCALLLQGTAWEKPSRKGQGEARDKGVMPSGAILLDFLENKEDKRGKGKRRRGREGRQYCVLLLQGTLREKPFRKGKAQYTWGMY